MLYAQVARKNGAILRWPLRADQLSSALNVSLPSDPVRLAEVDLTQYNVYPVDEADAPPPSSPTRRVQLAEPRWEEGRLKRTWTEVEAGPDDLATAWVNLRRVRNARLRATDWSQIVTDISPELKATYAAYRQELRDLPEKTSNPFSPTWPDPPEAFQE